MKDRYMMAYANKMSYGEYLEEEIQKRLKTEMGQDPVFEYNHAVSYKENFDKWNRWNRREKKLYNEPEYSIQEAKKIFDEIYSSELKSQDIP
tara:strand:- start:586 stop:861 length:276 start_codon:yes stop_codon:yes gene_type:complete